MYRARVFNPSDLCCGAKGTNLYNKRPAWLADAHRKLDEAVFAAYGWSFTLTDAEILERLLALNHQRVGVQG